MKFYFKCSLSLALLFCFQIINAQVVGNKKITTKNFPIENFQSLLIDFPAVAEIDCSMEPALEITTDENIFKCIGIRVSEEKLQITQDKWLEASAGVRLKIGAKGLIKTETGGYGTTSITNISENNFELMNPVGKVILSGSVDNLALTTHKGIIDASNVTTENIEAVITGSGSVKIGKFERLDTTIHDSGIVIHETYFSEDFKGSTPVETNLDLPESRPAFVNIKISNNKFRLLNAVVRGPKAQPFSYGLAFFPYQKKKERWPVGTRIFKENSDGTEDLLTTINAGDSGKTVEIFR